MAEYGMADILGSLANAGGTTPIAKISGGKVGEGGGLGSLFNNKLFLQFLGAAGNDLANKTGGANTMGVLNQSISSGDNLNLLRGILLGKHPGVNASIDDKGLKIGVQRATPVGQPGYDPGQTGVEPLDIGGGTVETSIPATTPTSQSNSTQQSSNQPSGNYGPFSDSQLDFSGADLAGISPEMINQALGLKLQSEELKNKRLHDIATERYNSTVLSQNAPHIAAETALANAQVGEHTPQFTLPGMGNKLFTRDEYLRGLADIEKSNSPTDLIKNFNFAKTPEGGGFKGSIEEFKQDKETGDWTNYLHVKANDPKYKKSFAEYQLDLKRASAPYFTPYETKTQTDTATREGDIKEAGYPTKVAEKLATLRYDEWDKLPETTKFMTENPKATYDEIVAMNNKWQKVYIIRQMDSEIKNVYGKDIVMKKDGWYKGDKLIRSMP
jgi:hypothetical protein